ncbi:nucleotidyltransferase [Flavobacterium sp. LC2016-23]|uniref:nucleotidyltransferase n=1 Tax=Flavobacterium sp. LC2016-23 TaxID=2666330 RepID=UPI0012AF6182|nr:nucleotidyltransferase [Flavobacterium sp. LC2016-23]MRX40411.1 nucleotidyltransferase [Flavobacterium sp. LC2016-23]
MARQIEIIQKEILDSIASDENLAAMNSTSKVAFYRLITYIVAFSAWTLEKLFDIHKKEIDTAIYEQKSGRPSWYKNMALAFQHGFDLVVDTDKFDNTGYTDDQIEASKIIQYCSVKESAESNRLIIKVASEHDDLLTPLTDIEITSFTQYLNEIKYAGVKINVVNNPADLLRLDMDIYIDVLVIDENGNSIVNGGKPVENAIKSYMKSLPFDGELVINDLIEKLRAVDGVINAHIKTAESSYYDTLTVAYLPFAPINVKTIPVAGYFEIVNFDNVSYVV